MNSLIHLLQHPLLLVGGGGAMGSMLRYCVSRWIQSASLGSFPVATFIVNAVGSFLLGCLAGYFAQKDHDGYLLLGVGFCGGFTTFSTFSLEMIERIQSGEPGIAFLYATLSVLLGLGATAIGIWLFR